MKTTIGAYDPATRTVAARFEQGEIVHDRSVNACHDEGGEYDAEATAARVADVGRGVAVKIGLGVIAQPEATEEPAPAPEEPTPEPTPVA